MIVQLLALVVRIPVDGLELQGYVGPALCIVLGMLLPEYMLPLGINRGTHVESVKPHLVGIHRLMEEASRSRKPFGNARMLILQLIADKRRRILVPLGILDVSFLQFLLI